MKEKSLGIVVLCCWILLAFLVDVSRSQRPAKDSSQENDKPEDAALPKDTDAASSNSTENEKDDEKKKESEEKVCDPNFVCPENRGNYADPCTCRRFYICSTDGAAHRSFCPNGLYWDDEKKICTYKNEAKCGPLAPKKKEEVVIKVKQCDRRACQLPYCYCSRNGDESPETNRRPQNSPQLAILTFDGAVNLNNMKYYDELLKLKGPFGTCPLRGTFFVKNDYNNYAMIEELYYRGNEIAVNSVTGRNLAFENLTIWREELETMRDLLGSLANVPAKDILGVRAPSLKVGGNAQYTALIESNFLWDSSISTKTTDKPIWPYTLDYAIPHECKIKSCPTKAFPGVWEIPVNLHYVEGLASGQCSYLDQCVFALLGSEDVFEWLQEDFRRHYDGNRAPYMLPFHTNWFTHAHQVEGLMKFVRWSLQFPDVYYVTATEALLWMLEPSDALLTEVTQSCDVNERSKPCSKPNTCELPYTDHIDGTQQLRYLTTCNPCPNKYPSIPSLDDQVEDTREKNRFGFLE